MARLLSIEHVPRRLLEAMPAGPVSLDAVERAVDAVIEARPPALMAAVRQRLSHLGADHGEEARALIGRLLDLFVECAPERLAAVEAALEAGDDGALQAGVALLGGAAAHLGATPLARLCADLEARADSGSVPPATAVRAALRRELTVTCRVLSALAAELPPVRAARRPVARRLIRERLPAPCPAHPRAGRL